MPELDLVANNYPGAFLFSCVTAQSVPDIDFDGIKGQHNSCQMYAKGCLLSMGGAALTFFLCRLPRYLVSS